jgi:hypothetical protein
MAELSRVPLRPVSLACCLIFPALLLFVACGTAGGDETTPDYFEGTGIQFRGAHIEGQGVPQIQSITPIELFPYMIYDESLFFSDLRVFPTNNGTVGGNAGFGYRYYSEGLDRVFGASGWYDGDNTRNFLLQQLGLSLESYAGPFDVRSNLYYPIGPTTRQNSLFAVNGSAQFQGDNLVFSQFRSWFSALKGFDAEAGIPLPGEFLEERGTRLYGGGYHFSDSQNSITGASVRLQSNLIAGLDAQVQVTYDNFFQTRAFVGFSYTFGALHRSEMKQTTAYGRIGEHITRNYTVVAEPHAQYQSVTATDPATGKPYTFAHVASGAAAGGNGSVASPFQTISAAQLAGRDVIFVQAGSVFNGASASVVLNPGNRIFGDGAGVQHFLPVPQFGSLLLPQGAGNLPVLANAAGDAVILASNSQFSGFAITHPGGNGIIGTNVQNVLMSNVGVDHAGGSGILLAGATGPITIANAAVSNAGGPGVNIQGGTGPIAFLDTTTVSGATGPSVLINNLAAAGSVSFASLGIDHRKSTGVEIDSSAGTVVASGTTTISNETGTTASALAISGSSGSFSFNQTEIAGANGATGGVNLQNDTGTTFFNRLDIGSLNGTALVAHNAGNLTINPAVNNQVDTTEGGSIVAANGAAIDLLGTNLNVNLTSVSSDHASTAGISLVNTTGFFAVYGSGTTAGSGGTIQNAPAGIFLQSAGITGFRLMTLDSNSVGLHANGVTQLLVGSTTITNSATYGIDALNSPALNVANSTFSGNGAANIRVQVNTPWTYSYTLQGNSFTSASADNVVVSVLPGGGGSTMNFLSTGNSFTNTLAGTAGLRLGWNGILAATIDSSNFAVSGGSNTGVLINNSSTTALSTISYTNNTFASTGGTDTALNIAAAGPSQITVFDNLAQFNATNGTAYLMSLAPSSFVNIASNSIVDTQGGATGILFNPILGPGSVTINDNTMQLTSQGAFSDRGIIFTGTTGTIQLISTQNNIITNAATPFFVPVGTTTGGIEVNGADVP